MRTSPRRRSHASRATLGCAPPMQRMVLVCLLGTCLLSCLRPRGDQARTCNTHLDCPATHYCNAEYLCAFECVAGDAGGAGTCSPPCTTCTARGQCLDEKGGLCGPSVLQSQPVATVPSNATNSADETGAATEDNYTVDAAGELNTDAAADLLPVADTTAAPDLQVLEDTQEVAP